MEEDDYLTDPSFLGILSPEDQQYLTETMFPGQDIFQSRPHTARDGLLRSGATDIASRTANGIPNLPSPLTLQSRTLLNGCDNIQTPRPIRTTSFQSHGYSDNSLPNLSPSSGTYGSSGGTIHGKESSDPLTTALDRLTASLNSDGTLSLTMFESIVKELSEIECLQSMLLFRPNKKKGKGGRQPAKDPRLDPNMDPRKAKRIVANRQSAARSKQKQKRQLESLHLQHDTLMIQTLLCTREKEKVEKEIEKFEHEIRFLEEELLAMRKLVQQTQQFAAALVQKRDSLRIEVESKNKPPPPSQSSVP